MELLSQFKFTIIYTPGKDNGRADALSRQPEYQGESRPTKLALLSQNEDGTLGPPGVLSTTTENRGPNKNNRIRGAYQDSDFCRKLQQNEEGLYQMNGKTYIPDALMTEIIAEHHDAPHNGHPGGARTLELIKRSYDHPNLQDKVRKYIRKCSSCQKNKHNTHAKYGLVQFAQVPRMAWQEITMDFITKLPKSKDPITKIAYDAILVIVDRLTKYCILIPFREDYSAEDLGRIVLDRLIRDHGIPEAIISDRDKLFKSRYWKTLIAELGGKVKMSTAYHPETDGQTERTNQTLEQYLRHYVNQKQNNWVQLLPMAQLALNDKISETTGLTPFFANYGRHPELFRAPRPNPSAEKALIEASQLKETQETIAENIEEKNEKTRKQQDRKRKKGPQLKKGDKVYLKTKNLRTKKASKKLDHVKVGPFLVKEVKGPNTIELELPKDTRIHPVFHISLLEPADPETPLQETFQCEPEDGDTYEVEAIVGEQDGQFLVKWKGYPDTENTWHFERDLGDCKKALRNWRNSRRQINAIQEMPDRSKFCICSPHVKMQAEDARAHQGLSPEKGPPRPQGTNPLPGQHPRKKRKVQGPYRLNPGLGRRMN
jgi:transposase InsO family protein